jgi:hypothetical protein
MDAAILFLLPTTQTDMPFADTRQSFQDWFTQQWIIIWGRKLNLEEEPWLKSPFGEVGLDAEDYIAALAKRENLVVDNSIDRKGLLSSFDELRLPEDKRKQIAAPIIDFYENTSAYDLQFSVKWNPLFKPFGLLVNKLFSNRINQLNIPGRSKGHAEALTNEIIRLVDAQSGQVQCNIWLRRRKESKQVIYLGIYGTCSLPSGATCVKAAFPLPNGNATVLLIPDVGPGGELILSSSGRKSGDAGFYFLLRNRKGNTWSRYHRSFRDQLTVTASNNQIDAEQVLTLWGWNVLTIKYQIKKNEQKK